MVENNYDEAVEVIKTAILRSQYDSASYSNGNQLALYYGVGKYISLNSRKGFWGKGAIDTISERLSKELPGLRGFTSRNLRYMRTFYEEWISLDSSIQKEQIEAKESGNLELASSKTADTGILPIWNSQVPNYGEFPMADFLHIGFTHHRVILGKVKEYDERLFYISRCASEHYSVDQLKERIAADDYHHQGTLPNNFLQTLPASEQAFRAINSFKDEYLLDYINVEEIGIRDKMILMKKW